MSYLRDRLIQAGVTFYLIVTFGFVLNKLLPGGPVDFLREDIQENPTRYGLPPDPEPEAVERLIRTYVDIPVDKPLHEAYVIYLRKVFFQFDLGESILISRGTEVTQLLLQRAPWTIFLSTVGLLYGLVVGIFLGALMAYYEGTKFDVAATVTTILDNSVPSQYSVQVAAARLILIGAILIVILYYRPEGLWGEERIGSGEVTE